MHSEINGFHETVKNERKKTVLRAQFDGEAEVIKKQIGSLEEVRIKLDLSARKMCQLLMVDPSAWNRWTTGITKVPPHIYRSLQWYMILNEKLPGVDPRFFIPKKNFFRSPGAQESISNNEQTMMTQYYQTQSKNFELEVKSLKNQLNILQKLLMFSLIILGLLLISGFIKIFLLK
jgi:hypothetical protein